MPCLLHAFSTCSRRQKCITSTDVGCLTIGFRHTCLWCENLKTARHDPQPLRPTFHDFPLTCSILVLKTVSTSEWEGLSFARCAGGNTALGRAATGFVRACRAGLRVDALFQSSAEICSRRQGARNGLRLTSSHMPSAIVFKETDFQGILKHMFSAHHDPTLHRVSASIHAYRKVAPTCSLSARLYRGWRASRKGMHHVGGSC